MPSFPFSRRTNIENLKQRLPCVKFMHAHLPDFLERKSACIPRFHSTYQVTRKLRVTGADEQPHDFFEVAFGFEHQKNWLVRIQHPTRPDRENGRAADVERARNMTASKGEHRTGVHEHSCFFVDRFFERLWRKTWDTRKIAENIRSLCVHLFHHRIVLRYRWRRSERVISELLYVIELQEFVEFSFITNRAAYTIANVRPTWRTGAVIRINHHMVGELEIKIAQSVKLFFGEFLGVLRAQQIRSTSG